MTFARTARAAMQAVVLLLAGALAACTVADPRLDVPAPHTPDTVAVRLIAFNDFHGNLQPPPDGWRVPEPRDPAKWQAVAAGGVANLAAEVHQLQQAHPLNLVVAAGDLVGASPLASSLSHDEAAIDSLNALGLQLSSVGNHEFDRGRDELLRQQLGGCFPGGTPGMETCIGGRFGGAKFEYLAANVVDLRSGHSLFPGYAIETLQVHGQPLRIGFIGLVLRGTPHMLMPGSAEGLRFTDEAEAANALVPVLHAQGVNTIVLLIHQGGENDGSFNDCAHFSGEILPVLDRLDAAIKVVVSGHTHQAYVCRIGERLLTSAGSYGRLVTSLDLQLRTVDDTLIAASAENHLVLAAAPPADLRASLGEALPPDPAVSQVLARYAAISAPIENRVVGRVSADITRRAADAGGESALGDVVADALLEAAAPQGAQIALTNPGGLRTDLLRQSGRAGIAEGDITYGNAFAALPFGNRVVSLSLSGAQLLVALQQQWGAGHAPRMLQISRGLAYQVRLRADGQGTELVAGSVRVLGQPLRAEAHYRVAVNEFLAAGGDGFTAFTHGTDAATGAADVDALVTYLQHHSPLAPPAGGRIRLAP